MLCCNNTKLNIMMVYGYYFIWYDSSLYLPLIGNYRRYYYYYPSQILAIMTHFLSHYKTDRDRLARLRKVNSGDCLYCEGTADAPAHLLSCTTSTQVSSPLTRCMRTYFPNIPPEDIVILRIPTTESLDFPIFCSWPSAWATSGRRGCWASRPT